MEILKSTDNKETREQIRQMAKADKRAKHFQKYPFIIKRGGIAFGKGERFYQ